jgi:hypothetical protein
MQFAEALEWLDLLEIVDPDNPELDPELADRNYIVVLPPNLQMAG